ncbi:ribosome biogenesis GTPase A [Oxobacter pfennigii]|uniref:Ribosome biogenesis GTPase A n=1 Tax=Oxobacter pfennigii TaxID=36849 RepID=A0A0P8YAE6_9CLOT|nr:ribosome biogenesis GTPase YlqF [Oxobacter pfennigii]KPU43929.1 ribosome biogenesis GTPase A [Oxobacter pfennigii]
MNIQWYPGHMTKAKRQMAESLKQVELVIELLDARIPKSSKNPDIDSICGNKPRIVLLNKSDLADSNINKQWINYYKNLNLQCLEINSLTGSGQKELTKAINDMFQERNARLKAKGIISKPVRALIAGIPNVGKSSLINRLAGKASTKTGDRPGVTKGKQWIKIGSNLELMDTPGILWPKFEDEEVGFNLAFTGAIRDEIMDIIEISIKFIEKIKLISPDSLKSRYKLDDLEGEEADILDKIGKNRGCIIQGGQVDRERTANIILDEYRGGKLGRISLEMP